jgi:hypothetical protein
MIGEGIDSVLDGLHHYHHSLDLPFVRNFGLHEDVDALEGDRFPLVRLLHLAHNQEAAHQGLNTVFLEWSW